MAREVSLTPDLAARLREMVAALPEPTTCREYLGRDLGYCDGAAQVPGPDGRSFCTDHAKERGFRCG